MIGQGDFVPQLPREIGPPGDDPRPRLSIQRADHRRPRTFTIVSRAAVGYGVHWAEHQPSGVLCMGTRAACEPCRLGRRWRPTYWLAAVERENDPVVLVEIPPGAADYCRQLFSTSQSMRGRLLTLTRMRNSKKAPVRAVLGPARQGAQLPEEPDVRAAVQRSFGIPWVPLEGGGP